MGQFKRCEAMRMRSGRCTIEATVKHTVNDVEYNLCKGHADQMHTETREAFSERQEKYFYDMKMEQQRKRTRAANQDILNRSRSDSTVAFNS